MASERASISPLRDIRRLGAPSCILISLLAAYFSCTAVFGTIGWLRYREGSLEFDGQLAAQLAGAIPLALLGAAGAAFLLMLLFARMKRAEVSGAQPKGAPRKASFFIGGFSRRHILRCSLVILACWLPYLIAFSPGILTYDPLWSLVQCLGSGALPMISPLDEAGAFSAHKPLVHTWLLGGFLLAGDAAGSQTTGILAYVGLQCACTAASLAASCCYAARLKAPWQLRMALVAFCALFPFFPLYALNCFNDSLFSWLYILWFLCVIEITRTRGAALLRPRFAVSFALLGVALACTKNPGIYLVLATVLFEALVCRRALKAFAAAFLAPALVWFAVLPLAVYPAANVVGTSSNEALGAFYQATAAYVSQHGDEVTDGERAAIDAVLDYDRLAETYDFATQDPVKTLQRTDADGQDILRYLATWFAMGAKHPGTYALSLAIVPMPFCCPAAEFTYYDDAAPKDIDYYLEGLPDDPAVREAASRLDIQRDPALDDAKRALHDGLSGLTSIPILGWPFGLGLWATWVPLFTAVGVFAGKRRLLPAFIPVALSLALLAISPWAMARYALPLVYTAPLLAALLFSRQDSPSPGAHQCGR